MDEHEVRAKLVKTLQVDEEKAEGWYESSKPTIILKGVESEMALKYVEAIRGCGAKCDLQAVGN